MNTPAKILIAEDEVLLGDLLAQQLARSMPGLTVTAVQTVAQLEKLSGESFDVAVVDLALADGNALDWLRTWTAANPHRKAIVLTSRTEDFILHSAFQSSVTGYVHKTDGLEFLELAIRTVHAGGSFYSPKIQAMRSRLNSDPQFFAKILSEREQSLLKLIGEGLGSGDIAATLGIKEATVADHRKNIMQKLELHSQAELRAYAIEKGFIVPHKARNPTIARHATQPASS